MIPRACRDRLYPTAEQEQPLHRTLGCVRLVCDRALNLRTEAWNQRQERVRDDRTSRMLTQRKKRGGLNCSNEVGCVPLQPGLRNLPTAFANVWAGRAKSPRFKQKRNGSSEDINQLQRFHKRSVPHQKNDRWVGASRLALERSRADRSLRLARRRFPIARSIRTRMKLAIQSSCPSYLIPVSFLASVSRTRSKANSSERSGLRIRNWQAVERLARWRDRIV